jgi:gamma-glutamyl:cysteine ligase YbdK (ATP-grasp superfamily)
MALHVHVGVPGPEDAVRVLNGLRRNVPMLLALSANSPFWQGRDGGLASSRTAIFVASLASRFLWPPGPATAALPKRHLG